MSRIGKKPVTIPSGVELKIDKQSVQVKGKLGTLTREFHKHVLLEINNNEVNVKLNSKKRDAYAIWGLSRALLNNMVVGVSDGFQKVLEINGVGYRAAVSGKVLKLTLGFSHPVDYPLPDGIEVKVEKTTRVIVKGIDPEVIGKVCAEIREFRPPEPYKGKGIRYEGEYILRKEGKKK
ncbi:MAG: 50S ribosomal protein L6 [Magnetococcales bacterium]|nr:50S ribosomal protein L6 [Magnetococcales bacterium]